MSNVHSLDNSGVKCKIIGFVCCFEWTMCPNTYLDIGRMYLYLVWNMECLFVHPKAWFGLDNEIFSVVDFHSHMFIMHVFIDVTCCWTFRMRSHGWEGFFECGWPVLNSGLISLFQRKCQMNLELMRRNKKVFYFLGYITQWAQHNIPFVRSVH